MRPCHAPCAHGGSADAQSRIGEAHERKTLYMKRFMQNNEVIDRTL